MSLFLAAGAALLMIAAVLSQRLRAAERRDTLGLRAARSAVVHGMWRAVIRQRIADIDRLRVPPSLDSRPF